MSTVVIIEGKEMKNPNATTPTGGEDAGTKIEIIIPAGWQPHPPHGSHPDSVEDCGACGSPVVLIVGSPYVDEACLTCAEPFLKEVTA